MNRRDPRLRRDRSLVIADSAVIGKSGERLKRGGFTTDQLREA